MFQRTRDNSLKTDLNRLTRTINKEVRKFRLNQMSFICQSLHSIKEPKKFWRKFNKLVGNEVKNSIPVLTQNNIHHVTSQAKANILNSTLQAVQHDFNDNNFCGKTYDTVNTYIKFNREKFVPLNSPDYVPTSPSLDHDVTLLELRDIIAKLSNKAPGIDTITNSMIKKLPLSALLHIIQIFNLCISLGYFPSCWKIARVTFIHKPGKPKSNPSSYRPISLLSCLGKLFERIIATRLLNYFENSDLFNLFQAGFRPNLSTVTHLLSLSEDIYSNFNKKCSTFALFLDVEKAFDAVWHNGLRFKLRSPCYNLPPRIVRLLSNFLTDRLVFTEINGFRSSAYTPLAGVPQGSVLSPILFNIYVNDIPPPKKPINISQFADDIAIWAVMPVPQKHTKRFQDYLNILLQWCNNWRIKINPSKTTAIFFPFTKHKSKPKVKIKDVPIPLSKTAKFLGVTFAESIKRTGWKLHFNEIFNRLNYKFIQLLRITGTQVDFNVSNITVYKQYIRPTFEYAAPIFLNMHSATLDRLQVFQNKCLRFCLHLPRNTRVSELHRLANIPLVKVRLTELISNYLSNLRLNNPYAFYQILDNHLTPNQIQSSINAYRHSN